MKYYSKEYFQHNKKNIEKKETTYGTNSNCALTHNLSSRNYRAQKGNVETSSIKDLLGVDIEICKDRIEIQLTTEMSCNIYTNHIKSKSLFDVSKDQVFKEDFTRKNTQ